MLSCSHRFNASLQFASAGVGRTGTFIVIDTMVEKVEDQQPIDIYNCVASLRTKRQEMVQTEVFLNTFV